MAERAPGLSGVFQLVLQLIRARLDTEIVRFLIVGGFSAFVNLLSRWLLNFVMGYSAAILLGYLCGMVTAFILFRRYVFPVSRLDTATEARRFVIVNIVALIQVWAVSVFLAEWLFPRIGLVSHAHDIAHFIGVAVPTVTSYLGHKHYSFQKH